MIFVFASIVFATAEPTFALELSEARTAYQKGDYPLAIESASDAVERGVWNEGWPRLLIDCYLTTGAYQKALEVYESQVQKFASSLPLRLQGIEVFRYTNQPVKAAQTRETIRGLLERTPWRYNDRDSLIPLGKFFLDEGEDPRKVLEICFDQAIREDSNAVEAYLEIARLALTKHDAAEAAKATTKAIEIDPENPSARLLAAKAWSSSDSERATSELIKALELNPKHLPSLLFQAQQQIDQQKLSAAAGIFEQIESINPRHPELWAYRAAIANLKGEFKQENEFRKKALEPWKLNPNVDYLIGSILSRQYRFVESVAYQRRSLKMAPEFVPAKQQLAQDLLRLGQTEEGWKVTQEVREADSFDVSIFNLTQLKKELDQYATLEFDGFIVRMDRDEAVIYGDAVTQLLSEARRVLTEKYAVELNEPITVEIFTEQADFAIRTFGLPGGEGFLGVCFGNLITANSPSALRETPTNWESVLWHEYCHVITLQKTNNRMPRWLSEGLSVYEERQQDARWGQRMTPTYQTMIRSDDLTPLSQMSTAFLAPKSPLHLQFAYYEASLAVEFLLEQHDADTLNRLLTDLGVGMTIDQGLERSYGNADGLDAAFEAFILGRANAFEPETDFDSSVAAGLDDLAELQSECDSGSNNYFLWRKLGILAAANQATATAIQAFEQSIALHPSDASNESSRVLLADLYQKEQRIDDAYTLWANHAEQSNDCDAVLGNLIEVDISNEDYESAAKWIEQRLAIDPVRQALQSTRLAIAEERSIDDDAVAALQALTRLDPIDPAGLHFRLAQYYEKQQERNLARHHVLIALEEAPRYRDALRLLVKLND